MTEVEGRRPLNSRNWRFFRRLAAWMATTSVTPNMISGSSMIFGLLAGISFAATAHFDVLVRAVFFLIAAVFIQLRLVANLLDGMVAVEGGKRSAVGLLYNEVPDRISDSLILIGAGYSVAHVPTLGWCAALIAVFVAYVRAMGGNAGVGEVFAGPMAKPQRMALATIACVICAALAVFSPRSAESCQAWTIQSMLVLVIIGGAATSLRRLRIIATKMREADRAVDSEASQTS